jgi:hypothetical protein
MSQIYCFNDIDYDLSNDSLNEFPLFTLESLAVHCNVNLKSLKITLIMLTEEREINRAGNSLSLIALLDAICDYRDNPFLKI